MNIFSNLWEKLRNKKYRKAFVEAQLKRGLPFQISALRKKRGWSQAELAEMSRLTQGVISRAENPDYGNLTFNTVLEIASGLDMAFIGKFVPFSELVKWHEDLSEESVLVPTFAEEDEKLSESIQQKHLPDSFRQKLSGEDRRQAAPNYGLAQLLPRRQHEVPIGLAR